MFAIKFIEVNNKERKYQEANCNASFKIVYCNFKQAEYSSIKSYAINMFSSVIFVRKLFNQI